MSIYHITSEAGTNKKLYRGAAIKFLESLGFNTEKATKLISDAKENSHAYLYGYDVHFLSSSKKPKTTAEEPITVQEEVKQPGYKIPKEPELTGKPLEVELGVSNLAKDLGVTEFKVRKYLRKSPVGVVRNNKSYRFSREEYSAVLEKLKKVIPGC